MLTNIFYYNFYKPYIVKGTSSTKAVKKSNLKTAIAQSKAAKSGEAAYSYFLNKSIKSEVVSYAQDISKNLNSIKDTTKYLTNRYSKANISGEGERNNFADGLEDFVNQVNDFNSFFESTDKDSAVLKGYDNMLEDRIVEKEEVLSVLGVERNEDGALSFDKDKFNEIKSENYIDNIFDCADLFNEIYKDTCEVMEIPLAEHMNFRNLDYYYNYTYAPKNKEAFKLIETGLLVDICL